MKQLYTLLTALLLTASAFLPQQASAQAPEKMSYQAVVRDAGNALVTSTAVGMQLSILQTTATGTAVYVETQTPTTNINGLVSIEIGSGTVVSGDFTTIDWSNGPYFIKTETDPTGGTTYTITGTSQLMSVPYALHANTADSIVGGVSFTEIDGSVTNEIQDLQLAGNNLTITDNGTATTIDLSPYLDNTDTQLDSTDIATLGYVAGAHTIDTDTQLDSTDVAGLGFVAGAHTVNTDTQLDSTDIANLGYNAGGITTEVDGSVTNEIQTISRTGTTVTLSNGGGTFQDSVGVYTAGTGIDITNNVVSTVGCTYSIGDLVPALGGYIFYLDGSGCHGLVAKTQNEPSTYQWSTTDFYTSAFASGIFGGAQNTKKSIARAIVNGGTCPAATQASLTVGGFNDWYLPSKDELDMMYVNLHLQGLGGFATSYYWSSTEYGSSFAWGQDFDDGFQLNFGKYTTAYVRAVRAF
ncbi:MAG: hypothetical protein ACI9WO_001645 [Sphingobacteriales bacterium]|jgi:hypothetical protein